jgi:hypothetical protein
MIKIDNKYICSIACLITYVYFMFQFNLLCLESFKLIFIVKFVLKSSNQLTNLYIWTT